jgi:hypothetical protein
MRTFPNLFLNSDNVLGDVGTNGHCVSEETPKSDFGLGWFRISSIALDLMSLTQ